MSVRYLTQEWADAATEALQRDPGFAKEIRDRESTIVWHVERDGTETTYHLAMDHGTAALRLGPPPDGGSVHLSGRYDDVTAVIRGTLDGRKAFQSKRLRSDLKLIGVLKYIGVFHQLNRVLQGIDVDY